MNVGNHDDEEKMDDEKDDENDGDADDDKDEGDMQEASSNKYDTLFMNTLQDRHKSMCQELMSSVIKLLREDGARSVTFKNGQELWGTIQDCRSKHHSKIQLRNKRASCEWFGLPWQEELSKTKNPRNKRSKIEMISRYMNQVKVELQKEETKHCADLLQEFKSIKKIFWSTETSKEGKLIKMPNDGSCYYHSLLHFLTGKTFDNKQGESNRFEPIPQLIKLIILFLSTHGNDAYTPDGATIKAHIEDCVYKCAMKVLAITRDESTQNLVQHDIGGDYSGLVEMKVSYEEFVWLLERPAHFYPEITIVGWILATISQITMHFHIANDEPNISLFPLGSAKDMKIVPMVNSNNSHFETSEDITKGFASIISEIRGEDSTNSTIINCGTDAYFISSNNNHIDLFSPAADNDDIAEKVGVRLCFTSATLSSLLYSDTDIDSVLMDLPIYQIIVSENSFNNFNNNPSEILATRPEISLALAMYHSHLLRLKSDNNLASATDQLKQLHMMEDEDKDLFAEFLEERIGASQDIDESNI